MRINHRIGLGFVATVMLTAVSANAIDIVWNGGTGDWNVAGKWSPPQLPGASDNVFITNNGVYTVTVPAGFNATVGSVTVGGASGTQTLAIDRATLTLDGASVVNANGQLSLLVAQSVLNGLGNITVDGTLNWANGTINGTGNIGVSSGGSLAIGTGGVTLGRTLNNAGNISWGGANLTISGGNTLNNLVGATFDITGDGRLSGGPTTPINNSGSVRLTAGSSGTIVTAPLNNSGSVTVLATTLNLNLGGTHTGTFSVTPGATLNLGGGSHTLAGGSVVTSGSVLTVGGATTLVAGGTFGPGCTLTLNSGVATLNPGCDVSASTLAINGANCVVNYNSPGPVQAVILTQGTLGGTSPVTVTGPLTLSGGTVTNSLVTANGGLTISGNTTLNATKLVNPTVALWSAGSITGVNGAEISNLPGATFINTFDGNAAKGAGAASLFVNEGLFQKTNGTAALGTTSIDLDFSNTGTVEVRTNTLRYNINQQTAGQTLLDGGDLAAQAQPIQILGGDLTGAGLVTLANTQPFINSATLNPGLPLGRLDISGNYQQTASGVLNIELGGYAAGTTYDLITVTAGGAGGVATLGGTLNVTLANGFIPTNGAIFTFLTAGSRAGTFATFNYPSNELGMQLSYDATSAKVTVSNLKPVVANPISDPPVVTYGGTFNLQFPANTFSDPDGDSLTYTASGLPAGVTLDSATRTFSGAPTQVGVFPVAVVATDSGTPSLSATNSFTITVNPAVLTITADPKTKSYGSPDPALSFTVAGFKSTDTQASVLTGGLSRTPGETVAGGPYAITLGTLAASGNYTISFTGNTLTIAPATLTITAQGKTKTYGAPDPALTFTASGFQFTDTQSSVLTGVLGRVVGETVTGGPYAIAQGLLAANGNYTISFTGNTLTITPATLTITAQAKTKTYGAADPGLTFTAGGFQFTDTQASVLTGTLTRAAGETVAGSPYAITQGTLAGNGNYALSFTGNTLTITPATLTVTAQAQTKTYGAADQALTFTAIGFQFTDAQASVLTGTLTRAAGETVAGSPYTITQGTLAGNGNYTINFTGNTLAITPATLTVTAQATTKTYGAADPALTFTASGFQFTDTQASVLTGALTRAAGESVAGSPYAITQGTLAGNGNYALSFTGNTLTITPATLTVTAQATTKTYGAADPALTFTASGFQFTDTQASVLTGALTRAAGESVAGSPYAITQGTLAGNGNYTINFTGNTLAITPATLTVTAQATTKTYGAADPALTFTASGFQFTDTQASVLTGALTRAAGESVAGSPYAITQGTLAGNGNYTINFTGNTLAITPATLTVTAQATTKIYGAADPALTFTASGFQLTDTQASVLTGTLTRAAGETVDGSPYAITQGTVAGNGNYTISFTGNSLSITPAALTITAQAKTKTYGAADPALTFTASGFQLTDTQASVLTGTLTRAAGETVAGSPYAVTQGTVAGNGNYAISFTGNSLTITPATLTVTAQATTKIYGAADPALTFTASGFQLTDTQASVLTGTLTRAAGETVAGSPYAVTQGTVAGNGNYAISFTGNSLTITPATLTITAQAKTKTYGAADPALTFTATGFQFTDTQASVLTGTLTRAAGETVAGSPYAITQGTVAGNGNYTVSFTGNSLTITPANLTVTAQAKTKTYGAADPALTFTASGFQFTDTQASVLTGALTRATGETVTGSPYAITQGTLAGNGNYTISFNTGALTIGKAPLSVTPDSKTKAPGTADPAFTVSYAGLVNGDSSGVLSGTLIMTRAPGEEVGTYLITASGLTSDNYSITFNTGTLTITTTGPVLQPLVITSTNIVISWSAVSNANYRVQYKDVLDGSTWTDLLGDILSTRSIASKTDARTSTNRFYRVQLLP